MKISINLNDLVKVRLSRLGALRYNAKETFGFNQEEMNEYYSSKAKKEGDSIEGNLYQIMIFFGNDKDCFQDEEFEVISNY